MNTRNLIPARRLALKTKQKSIRRWILFNGSYLTVLGIAAVALLALSAHSSSRAGADGVRSDLAQANATLAALRQQSQGLKARVQANQELLQAPDWSILLTSLASSLGDEVVLTRIDSMGDSKGPVEAGTQPKLLRLSGIGRSQRSVTQFILKLERLNFFTKVRFVQTTPQVLRGLDSAGFELDCFLDSSNGAQP